MEIIMNLTQFPQGYYPFYLIIFCLVALYAIGILFKFRNNKRFLIRYGLNLRSKLNKDLINLVCIFTLPFLFAWRFFTNIKGAKLFLNYQDQLLFYGHSFFSNIALKHGVFPFWNPFIGFGFPIYSITRNPIFHLPNIIMLSFSGSNLSIREFAGYVILHAALFGCFTYIALRSMHLSKFSSLCGGLLAALSPAFIFRSLYVIDFSYSVIYFPLMLVILYKFIAHPTMSKLILGGLVAGLMCLTTQTNNLMFAFYILLAIAIYLLIVHYNGMRSLIVKISGLLGIGALGVGISAVHLLPVISFLSKSGRIGSPAQYMDSLYFTPIDSVINALLQNPYLAMFYFGHVLLLILIIIGVCIYRGNRLVRISLVTVIVLFSFVLGPLSWIYDFSYVVLPFFNKFRWFSRINHFAPVFIAILGAFGVRALEEPDLQEKKRFMNRLKNILGIVCLGSFFLILIVYPEKSLSENILYLDKSHMYKFLAFLSGTKARSLLLISISCAVMYIITWLRGQRHTFTTSLKAILLFSLISFGYFEFQRFIWIDPHSFISSKNPVTDNYVNIIKKKTLNEMTSLRQPGSEDINDILQFYPMAYHNVEAMDERIMRFSRWNHLPFRDDDIRDYPVSRGNIDSLVGLANMPTQKPHKTMPRAFMVADYTILKNQDPDNYLDAIENVLDWKKVVFLEKEPVLFEHRTDLQSFANKYFKNKKQLLQDDEGMKYISQFLKEHPADNLAHYIYGQYLEHQGKFQDAYNHYFFSNLLKESDRAQQAMKILEDNKEIDSYCE